ncbi:MAG: RNA methyltransferase [Proteobacteria bacterium]|nr:RNA methyltransferase [Pseudomonadota bacterium]HQR02968.1 RNA methyltransferase [Rhodocyclaceae bacterium]
MKLIQSRDNPTFRELRELAGDGRAQRRLGRTLIDGPHLVASYLARCGCPRLIVLGESGRDKPEIASLIATVGEAPIVMLKDALFREISGTATPVGILAEIDIPAMPESPRGSCVVLDRIQDAGNLGSILRSSAAAGIGDAVLGAGCAGPWTPRVLRAAQGAHFGLRIREEPDLPAWLAGYGGRSMAAVVADGVPVQDADLRGPVAWIFGNEGSGIAPALCAAATLRVTIPMATATESLNVAAAAAICLFEARRQNLYEKGTG